MTMQAIARWRTAGQIFNKCLPLNWAKIYPNCNIKLKINRSETVFGY